MAPFVVMGLGVAFLGLGLVLSRAGAVWVEGGELVVEKPVGPLVRRRRIRLEEVEAVGLGAAERVSGMNPAGDRPLVARMAGGRTEVLASGYDTEAMGQVAEVLGAMLERAGRRVAVETQNAKLKTQNRVDERLQAAGDAGRPVDSKVQCVEGEGTVTFVVPRTGFRGAAGFFLFFSVIWNGVTWTVFGFFLVDLVSHPSIEGFFPVVFLLLFVGVGIFTALVAVQFAFRRAVVVATEASLVFTQTGPVRNQERQWARGEIVTIYDGPSGSTINDRPVRELQVHVKGGERCGMLAGQGDGDLVWMAGVLRRFYGLGEGKDLERRG
jgi:hypothetical protein